MAHPGRTDSTRYPQGLDQVAHLIARSSDGFSSSGVPYKGTIHWNSGPLMNNDLPAPPPLLVEESDDPLGWPSRGTWIMITSLVIAKIGGLIVVFMIDPSQMAALFAVVSTWLWAVVLAILLSGPAAFWWRKRRVRARRADLQRAEWMVNPDGLPAEQ